MGQERLIKTFILAIIGIVVFALFKPVSNDPKENTTALTNWFYLNKSHQGPIYDGVIIGDSRGLRGISPSILEENLPGLDIFNYSFNSGGMNREMYNQAEKLLNPTTEKPLIILATTALSFQPWKRANSQFHEYSNKPRDQVWLNSNARWLSEMFQPLSPSIYIRNWLGMTPPLLLSEEFHTDGWLETDQQPWDVNSDLTEHMEKLAANQADPALIQDYLDQTRTWSDRGISVFGFVHPSHPATVEVEATALKFNQAEISAAFTEAGGIWLDFPSEGYDTYDGSHLTSASAQRFSHVLARAIADQLQIPTGLNPTPPHR